MPTPFALFVYSTPTKVSEDVWKEWYIKEHIRDMVYHKASRTAAFYQSASQVYTSREPPKDRSEDMVFLSVYQTDQAGTLKANWSNPLIRNTSKRWEEGLHHWDVGDLVRGEAELIEATGGREHDEGAAPYLVVLKITGEEATSKISSFQTKLSDAFSNFDRYHRTLSYRPIDQDNPESPAYTLHNFGDNKASTAVILADFESLNKDSLLSLKSELERIEPIKDFSFQLCYFKLVDAEGFGGRVRTPE